MKHKYMPDVWDPIEDYRDGGGISISKLEPTTLVSNLCAFLDRCKNYYEPIPEEFGKVSNTFEFTSRLIESIYSYDNAIWMARYEVESYKEENKKLKEIIEKRKDEKRRLVERLSKLGDELALSKEEVKGLKRELSELKKGKSEVFEPHEYADGVYMSFNSSIK